MSLTYKEFYQSLKEQNPELYFLWIELSRQNHLKKISRPDYKPSYKKKEKNEKELSDYKIYQKQYQAEYAKKKKQIYRCDVCNKGFIYPQLLEKHNNKPIHIKAIFMTLPFHFLKNIE